MTYPRLGRGGPSVTEFTFDAVDADAYERLRPGYSTHALAWLINTAMRVHDGFGADVAAGAGKLTRMLADGGVAAIAVEPSASMRTVLRSVTCLYQKRIRDHAARRS